MPIDRSKMAPIPKMPEITNCPTRKQFGAPRPVRVVLEYDAFKQEVTGEDAWGTINGLPWRDV